MKTDWNLIREVFNSAVNALETVDRLGIDENHRHLPFQRDGADICHVWDFLQSAWTYPENLSFDVVRARHDLNADRPYTNEKSRTLLKVAQLCAELIDAKEVQAQAVTIGSTKSSIEGAVTNLADWYRSYMISALEQVMKQVDADTVQQ